MTQLSQRLQEKVEQLIEIAIGKGFVTQDEVLEVFSKPEKHLEAVDEFFDRILEAEVDIFMSLGDRDDSETDLADELENLTNLSKKGLSDPVRMYLKEIGRIPLLTREEEIRLAQEVEAGDEVKLQLITTILELQKKKGMADRLELLLADLKLTREDFERGAISKEEFSSLMHAYKKELPDLKEQAKTFEVGEQAKKQLADANLRLVVSIAKKYIGRGLTFLDLIQEGNKGLIRAVEKYDWTKGFKFSTYATWWIRQAITRSIADQARTIRIPVHMVETINKLMRASRKLMQELGREPSPEEIGERMDMEPEKVREILKISQNTTSLETPVGDGEDDSVLGDFIPDDKQETPYDMTSREMLKENIDEVLQALSDREAKVLRMRFGLSGNKMMTLEEVGRKFGVTRERIRQIEAKALRKLKHPSRRKKLQDFLE